MTISVNAAPNASDATVASTVSAGTTSTGDIHNGTIVTDSDDNDDDLVITAAKAGTETTSYSTVINLGDNANSVTASTTSANGLSVTGTYGTLVIGADGTYVYTASSTNSIAYGATATDTFTFTTRDDEGSAGSAGSHAYDVGTITFTVASSISLTNDTDSVDEDSTVTKTGAQADVLNNDTADSNGLVVTHIGTGSNSDQAVAVSYTHLRAHET